MVDAERLSRLLARIADDVAGVRMDARADLTLDEGALRAVKYGFVVAIEGCVRAAQHVVTSDALGMPESNAHAIRLLARHGVVPSEVADPIARAVGFRNLLVHEYAPSAIASGPMPAALPRPGSRRARRLSRRAAPAARGGAARPGC